MQQNTKAGFTLIELLVVVLIIGILAAIAVSQYQKVVEKSRWMEGLNLARAIHEAQQLYKLEHGSFATRLNQLDLKLPASLPVKPNTCNFDPGTWYSEDWIVRMGVFAQSNSNAEVTLLRNGGKYNCYGFTVLNNEIYCAKIYPRQKDKGCYDLFKATDSFDTNSWRHFKIP